MRPCCSSMLIAKCSLLVVRRPSPRLKANLSFGRTSLKKIEMVDVRLRTRSTLFQRDAVEYCSNLGKRKVIAKTHLPCSHQSECVIRGQATKSFASSTCMCSSLCMHVHTACFCDLLGTVYRAWQQFTKKLTVRGVGLCTTAGILR